MLISAREKSFQRRLANRRTGAIEPVKPAVIRW